MKKLFYSFGFAWNGIRYGISKELNLKIHCCATLLVTAAGFYFSISAVHWIALLCCMGLVLGMELINTAIEKLCDVIHPAKHPGIEKVKDIAAGAVLLSAIAAMACGLLIFIPEIIYSLK